MLKELIIIHSRITKDECMRIVLTRDDYVIHVDKTDLVGEFNNCFRIIRANGRIVSINPDQVAMVSTMPKEAYL